MNITVKVHIKDEVHEVKPCISKCNSSLQHNGKTEDFKTDKT